MPLFGRHQPPLQQQPQQAITRWMLDSLRGPGGIRVAETTARPAGTFTGGGLVVQRFLRPPTGPNHPDSLDQVPVAMNSRRALNRQRGRPGA